MSTELSDVLGRARVIDLSYPLTADFPLFPVYDPVRVAQKFSCERDGFFVKSWAFDEHSGTHVDAPAHFGAGAATVWVTTLAGADATARRTGAGAACSGRRTLPPRACRRSR